MIITHTIVSGKKPLLYTDFMPLTLTAGRDDGDRRLDRILRKALPDLPLSALHRLLRTGRVLVNGKTGRREDRVAEGSVITVSGLPQTAETRARAFYARASRVQASASEISVKAPDPQSGTLDILREEQGLLVLNKPAGLAVHGQGSLDEMVRSYLAGTLPPSLSFKPGPLHRLDKPTSGIIVFSLDLEGARFFSAMLREGRIKKQYLAIADGTLAKAEIWEDSLVRDTDAKKTAAARNGEKGKKALTAVTPLAVSADGTHSLLLAEIFTGRTHQIRAQAAARGHPLSGDKKYGGSFGGFFLHAWKIEIPPRSSGSPSAVTAPLPRRFRRKIEELFPGFNEQ
jgi:23S rRNA pseudouridine955/2504/2580 synthase